MAAIPDWQDELRVVQWLLGSVREEITGEGTVEFLNVEPPSARFFAGVLSPPATDPETDAVSRRFSPSSIEMHFRARVGAVARIGVDVAMYVEVVPLATDVFPADGGLPCRRYRKRTIHAETELTIGETGPEFVCETLTEEVRTAVEMWLQSLETERQIWWGGRLDQSTLSHDARELVSQLEGLNNGRRPNPGGWRAWQFAVRLSTRPDGDRADLSLELVNETKAASDTVPLPGDPALFEAGLTVQVQTDNLLAFELDLAPRDYRYPNRANAIGRNCAIEENRREGRVVLRTTPLPIHHQSFLRHAAPTVALGFEDLASSPLPILQSLATDLRRYSQKWEAGLATAHFDEQQLKWAQADLVAFEGEIRRFEDGIEILETSQDARRAFCLANEVFRRAGADSGISGWRPFQLVFIVTAFRDIVARNDPSITDSHLEVVDVIWFPTGGGKTEAYLGLVLATLFYDRLRQKVLGVSAVLRFPLRMLSLQQLQRLMRLVVIAEDVRLEELVAGDPFRCGYWVGRNNLPNKSEEWMTGQVDASRWQVLFACPHCGSEEIRVVKDSEKILLLHRCESCGRDLPILVVDEEIYRSLPAVLVATVDKLATLGFQRKIRMLLGQVDGTCQRHGYFIGDRCSVQDCKAQSHPLPRSSDLSPSLHIQDELHLLDEELGTFDGHYETTMDTILSEFGSPPMKRVAATATIEAYENQSMQLYGRRARLFPCPGPQLNESFYSQVEREGEQVRTSRVYLGVLPFGKTIINAHVEILFYLHAAWFRLRELAGRDPRRLCAEVGLRGSFSSEALLALLDNYEVSLEYVTAIREGNQLQRSIDNQVNPYLGLAGLPPLNYVELTGNTPLSEVNGVLKTLQDPPAEPSERLNIVVGTSMLSHGVDIERINLMTFLGVPKATAEYVQASSRAGRRHVGLIVVVHRTGLERERSHFIMFRQYHEHLGRLVEPVAINRWSKFALDRTFAGLFQSLLLQVVERRTGRSLYKPLAVRRLIEDALLAEEEMAQLVRRAVGLEKVPGGDAVSSAIGERVDRYFRALRLATEAQEWLADCVGEQPMRSLRDVDENVPFFPRREDRELLGSLLGED